MPGNNHWPIVSIKLRCLIQAMIILWAAMVLWGCAMPSGSDQGQTAKSPSSADINGSITNSSGIPDVSPQSSSKSGQRGTPISSPPMPGTRVSLVLKAQTFISTEPTNWPPNVPWPPPHVDKAFGAQWASGNAATITPQILSLTETATGCTVVASCLPPTNWPNLHWQMSLAESTNLCDWHCVATSTNGTLAFLDTNLYSAAHYRAGQSLELNVADFGAMGDAWTGIVTTVQGSETVTFSAADQEVSPTTNGIIEIFGAGPNVSYNGSLVVTQQDLVAIITNMAFQTITNGGSLTKAATIQMSLPAGQTGTFQCTIGHNNAPAFQSAIDEASSIIASGYQNVTIDVPNGTYLLASAQILNPAYVMQSISDTHPALTIKSGGITFRGNCVAATDGTITNGGSLTKAATLLGVGAGAEHLVNQDLSWIGPGYAPFVPMRDTLMICEGPIANRQYPLRFENLTMDGGVLKGQQPYNYFTPIQGNGMGWDTTHHAVADWDGLVTYQMHLKKVFTHCVFQHWRGEILICWTGPVTNAVNEIDGCSFTDGNATAINMYYFLKVRHCVFDGLGKVMEYYQSDADCVSTTDKTVTSSWHRGSDCPTVSVFENNLITNIAPNNNYAITIVGARNGWQNPPFIFKNNVFHDELGINALQFSPACNISVIGNDFIGGNGGLIFTSAGVQPSDGTALTVMTNFVIGGNFFNCGNPVGMDGYPVTDIIFTNNTGISISVGAGYKDRFFMAHNTGGLLQCGPSVNQAGIQAGSYPMDSTNNNWGNLNNPLDGGDYAATNYLNPANGIVHLLRNNASFFYLDDREPGLIQSNSILSVYAQTWSGLNATNFYTGVNGINMVITNGAAPMNFIWNGTKWVYDK